MSEEEIRKLALNSIPKEVLVDRIYFFFEREKYYRERTYDLENIIDKAIEYIKENKYVSADENCEIIAGWRIDELLEILGDKENENKN